MKIATVLAAVVVSLAGCGARAKLSPSVLQRFDGMRSELRQADVESASVAADLQRLNGHMQADDVAGAQVASVRLKNQAATFQRDTARAASAIRKLTGAERNRQVRTYLQLAVETLSFQQAEARQLERLADVVWADPLLLSSNDQRMMWSAEGMARSDAEAAVRDAQRAALLRTRYRLAFRYVPVSRPTASTKGT